MLPSRSETSRQKTWAMGERRMSFQISSEAYESLSQRGLLPPEDVAAGLLPSEPVLPAELYRRKARAMRCSFGRSGAFLPCFERRRLPGGDM